MAEFALQPNGRSRRDLLRLGAASLGFPLLASSTTSRPSQVISGTTALPDLPEWRDFPLWEGEDYPDHPDPRARTVNNLKFLGLAMHNFAAVNGGRFPATAIRKGDEALLSWRVAILPFLEQFMLYERFHLDEAWDSPHNVSLLKEMPRVYAAVGHQGSTLYQRVVGRGSLSSGDEGTRVAEVDVSRPTLMIVEAAEPVPWTKPEDLPYVEGKPLPRLGDRFEVGSYAAFADGSVRFLRQGITPETLHALVMRC
jgi:hypothetical protein